MPRPRRSPLGAALSLATLATLATAIAARAAAGDPANIGSRLELFVDDALVERLSGDARYVLHHPAPAGIALVHDAPWEGSGSGYHSLFRDGPRYRMYYKAWHLDVSDGKLRSGAHPLFCCYAESADGVRWHKPELGLVEYAGSRANNIVLASGALGALKIDAGHPAVFRDENPAADPGARYKALVVSSGPHGLCALGSPDGLRWKPLADAPVIVKGAFDSQNLAFWDGARGCYRAYYRVFTSGTTEKGKWKPSGHRAIRTATSPDFVHWDEGADLRYADSPEEHLYTNQVKPYHRAPHLLIGFPTRYVERGWSDSMRALPEREHREQRAAAGLRYGTALTEGLLMASRDGVTFRRWNEAFLPPGIERPGTWNYGHQYIAWHLVETCSALPDAPHELSLYATESYWTGSSSALRRYTLRMDGFVSARAGMGGGELLTRPIVFSGKRLVLNFSSSAAGAIRVELQDGAGRALPGFALGDCAEIYGDSIARPVTWKGGGDLGALAGRAVRARFELRDADLYAYRFEEGSGAETDATERR